MPSLIVKPPLFQEEEVAITSEGENVVLRIGNSELRFQYEDALKISQWLRVRAKEAKRWAGDISRHWSAIAVIEDFKG